MERIDTIPTIPGLLQTRRSIVGMTFQAAYPTAMSEAVHRRRPSTVRVSTTQSLSRDRVSAGKIATQVCRSKMPTGHLATSTVTQTHVVPVTHSTLPLGSLHKAHPPCAASSRIYRPATCPARGRTMGPRTT